jgi:hypothetical protein
VRRRPRTFATFAGVAVVTFAVLAVGSAGRAARSAAKAAAGRSDPWRAYETSVDPGSAVGVVDPTTILALSGQPVNALDKMLAAPGGLTITWPGARVLVSRDGGRSWRVSLSASAGFWGIDFLDSPFGVAVGVNALYRTWDSGRHWQRIAEPRQPLVRVALLGGFDMAGLTTRGRLVTTRNGGLSWQAASWPRTGRAVCSVGDGVLVADQRGGVWRSNGPAHPFTQVVAGRAPPIKDGDWWVDLSCAGHDDVESLQAFPGAAGADVETIVRQSTDGGISWRRIVQISNGAANESAPLPAEAAAAGSRTACVFSYPPSTTLDIRCTSDRGRSFRWARTPPMPPSQYPQLHLQGVNFLGPARGWLEVVDTLAGGRRPARYQTQVWTTRDGGASWRVAYASPIRRIPPLP